MPVTSFLVVEGGQDIPAAVVNNAHFLRIREPIKIEIVSQYSYIVYNSSGNLILTAVSMALLLVACSPPSYGEASAQEQSRSYSITSSVDGKSYSIEGRSLGNATAMPKSFKIDPSNKSIEIEVNGKGNLQMTLPKAMIDGILIVTSGSEQIYFKHIDSNSTSTTVQIGIPKDTESIKIVATMVVPEFPFSAIAMIGIGLAAKVILTRIRLMSRF